MLSQTEPATFTTLPFFSFSTHANLKKQNNSEFEVNLTKVKVK
jgi:hypothetical protein